VVAQLEGVAVVANDELEQALARLRLARSSSIRHATRVRQQMLHCDRAPRLGLI